MIQQAKQFQLKIQCVDLNKVRELRRLSSSLEYYTSSDLFWFKNFTRTTSSCVSISHLYI